LPITFWLSFFQKPVSGSEGPKSDGNLPEDGIFPMGVFGFSGIKMDQRKPAIRVLVR
jgi:hypothetical protein